MPYASAHDGTRLYYDVAGNGAPVLLLTGAFSTLEDWHESGIFADLARERRVIAMDLRGHGKSDTPHDAGSYGWPKNAGDALTVLEAEDAHGVDVYGFSMGGQVAVAMLHGDTFRLRSLCGMGVYVPDAEFVPPAQQLLDRAASLRTRGLTAAALGEVSMGVGLSPLPGALDRALSGDAAAYVAEAEGQAAMDDQRPPPAGPPTLLIAGDGDPFAVALCKELPANFPYIRYRQLAGAGHFAGLGRAILDELRAFWRSL